MQVAAAPRISTAALVAARATRARAAEGQTRVNCPRISELLRNQVAAADLDKATEQLQVAESDLKRTQASIVEAERQVATAEKTLLYQVIRCRG